jgi:hypothetical protein
MPCSTAWRDGRNREELPSIYSTRHCRPFDHSEGFHTWIEHGEARFIPVGQKYGQRANSVRLAKKRRSQFIFAMPVVGVTSQATAAA